MIKEERLVEWLISGWDQETGERDESWFQGEMKPAPFEDLGTVEMLRNDVKRQQEELKNETHADGYLIAWGSNNGIEEDSVRPREVIVTKDGAYIWDWNNEDYKQVFIGTIYEKEWYDELLIEEYRNRKDYFAIVVYK